jgi:hypothetical protein
LETPTPFSFIPILNYNESKIFSRSKICSDGREDYPCFRLTPFPRKGPGQTKWRANRYWINPASPRRNSTPIDPQEVDINNTCTSFFEFSWCFEKYQSSIQTILVIAKKMYCCRGRPV